MTTDRKRQLTPENGELRRIAQSNCWHRLSVVEAIQEKFGCTRVEAEDATDALFRLCAINQDIP